MAAALTEEGFWPGRSDLQEFYPRVYLSNTFGARNLKKLQANGITHVLICGSYLQPAFPEKFSYKQMKLDDNATEAQQKALLAQLDEALDFVDTALKETDANVLLHCGQGRSRSGAVAAAIVMKREGLGAEEAISKVKQARPIVNPNNGFRKALQQFEASLKGLSGEYVANDADNHCPILLW